MIKKYCLLLISIFIFSCNAVSSDAKKSHKEIIKEIMIDAKNCTLITIDAEGKAHARAMDPFLPEDDFTVFMGTKSKSLKVQQIQQNSNVTLYYFDAKTVSYVTLQGSANIVNTSEIKKNYWKDTWNNFYNKDKSDYTLIQFTPEKANLISEKYSVLGDSITWKTPIINFKNNE